MTAQGISFFLHNKTVCLGLWRGKESTSTFQGSFPQWTLYHVFPENFEPGKRLDNKADIFFWDSISLRWINLQNKNETIFHSIFFINFTHLSFVYLFIIYSFFIINMANGIVSFNELLLLFLLLHNNSTALFLRIDLACTLPNNIVGIR